MKHGLTKGGKWHPLYRILKNIEARCLYPKATHYEYYGGRGISVCSEWRENPLLFVQWAEERGWKIGLDIDRDRRQRKLLSGELPPRNASGKLSAYQAG